MRIGEAAVAASGVVQVTTGRAVDGVVTGAKIGAVAGPVSGVVAAPSRGAVAGAVSRARASAKSGVVDRAVGGDVARTPSLVARDMSGAVAGSVRVEHTRAVSLTVAGPWEWP